MCFVAKRTIPGMPLQTKRMEVLLFTNMPAGNYVWEGYSDLELGDIGDIWEVVGFDYCFGSHTVIAPPTNASFDIEPNSVLVGESVTVEWSVDGVGVGCTLNGNPLATSGFATLPSVQLDLNGTHTIICSNIAGTVSASDSLVVNECSDANSPLPNYFGSTIYPNGYTQVSPYIPGLYGETEVFGTRVSNCPEVCSGGRKRYRMEGGPQPLLTHICPFQCSTSQFLIPAVQFQLKDRHQR